MFYSQSQCYSVSFRVHRQYIFAPLALVPILLSVIAQMERLLPKIHQERDGVVRNNITFNCKLIQIMKNCERCCVKYRKSKLRQIKSRCFKISCFIFCGGMHISCNSLEEMMYCSHVLTLRKWFSPISKPKLTYLVYTHFNNLDAKYYSTATWQPQKFSRCCMKTQ